ncbi:MAG: endolytic transglycosylase MltG [Oscillospiraceae bacterium]
MDTRNPDVGGQQRQPQNSGYRRPAQQGQQQSRPRRQSQGNAPRPKKDKPYKPSRKARIKNHWFRAIIMVLAVLAGSIFMAIFVLNSLSDIFGLNQEDKLYPVVVPEGADMETVADILGELGVVENPSIFKLYASLANKDVEVQPGEYEFNTNMGYDQIITQLKVGDLEDKVVTITFFEYLTVEDIAKLLEENGVCEADAFLDYLDNTAVDYDFYADIPDNEYRYHKLEGYVFPDTYEFYVPEKVSSVAKKFFDNFDNKITSDMLTRMKDMELTLDETLTLASIIQREADDPSEMRRVSSVFRNRLNNPTNFPNLQSDVTVFYVEDYIKPHMTATNQDLYDAYNTYVCDGLPAGPICNPGVEAIKAALYPADTDYYYFVTDVNMEYYFAVTLAEHERNIQLAAEEDTTGEGVVHGIGTREPEADEQK